MSGRPARRSRPAVRLGWALVPSHLVGEMAAQQGVARATPSVLTQAVYATLLERGEIDRHLRRTRRVYHSRRNALIDALARVAARVVGRRRGSRASRDRMAARWHQRDDDQRCGGKPRRRDPHPSPRLCRDRAAGPRAGARVRADRGVGDPARRPRAGGSGRPLAIRRPSTAVSRRRRSGSMSIGPRNERLTWSSPNGRRGRTIAVHGRSRSGGSSSWKSEARTALSSSGLKAYWAP